MKLLCLAAVVACCLAAACAQDDGTVRVSLTKRPLEADDLLQQRRVIEQRLLGAANAGEDIPILNFLDAQVSSSITAGFVDFDPKPSLES